MILNMFINDYSLAVNITKSLYQLAIFLQFMLALGLNSVITSFELLYITLLSHYDYDRVMNIYIFNWVNLNT